MGITKLLWAVGFSIALSACQTVDHHSELHGPESTLSDYGALEPATGSSSDNEKKILEAYAKRAGLKIPFPETPESWQLIVRGGFNAIDEQCETYMQAMFWADREMRTARENINLLGATTGTLLGVFGGPATAIATSAAAFGLATQALNNESKGLFFDVEPSGVRRIVSRSQTAYRQGIEAKIATYNSRPAAVTAIQGYLTLCLPSHIATQINQSIDSTKFQVTNPDDKTNPQNSVEQTEPTEPKELSKPESGGTINPAHSEKNTNLPNCSSTVECKITKEQLLQIQQALCIANPNGDFDHARKAKDLFRASNVLKNAKTTGGLNFKELDFLQNRVSGCNLKQFRNAYERFHYGVDNTYDVADVKKIEDISSKLRTVGITLSDNIENLEQLRSAILNFQEKANMPLTGEINQELVATLSYEADRP